MLKRYVAMGLTAVLIVAASVRLARAAWPSAGVRTSHGLACTTFVNAIDNYLSYCPFVSDYASQIDSYYAMSNTTTYLDFHVSSTSVGDSTLVSSCRQRELGTAIVCSTPAQSVGTGDHDLLVNPFSSIGGPANPYDYYYLSIATTESVDVIYGVSYL